MQSKMNTMTTITLKLSEKEALWLKSLVQNPINCDYEKEPKEDQTMRKAFWQALIDVKY